MKYLTTLSIILLLFASCAHETEAEKKLKAINTPVQAFDFIRANPQFEGKLLHINTATDTLANEKTLYAHKNGEIFTVSGYAYKVLLDTSGVFSKASYIFLDGSKLSAPAIDTLRKMIIGKYNAGTSFESLVAAHNMDGNTDGSTEWFGDRQMVPEFESAVKSHRLNEVFTVDVPANKWFYVVKKTCDTRQLRMMTLIRIKESG